MEIAPGFNARSLLIQLRKQTERSSDQSAPPIPALRSENDYFYYQNQRQPVPLPQDINTSHSAQDLQSTFFSLDDERYGPEAVRKIRVELEGETNGLREQLSSLKKGNQLLQTQNYELENRILLNKQKSDEVIAELRYQLAVLRGSSPTALTRKIKASTGNKLRSTGTNLGPPIAHAYSRKIDRSSPSLTVGANGFVGDNRNITNFGGIDTGKIEFDKVMERLYLLKFGQHQSPSQNTLRSQSSSQPINKVEGYDVDPVNDRTCLIDPIVSLSGSSSETNVLTNIKDFNSKEDDVMS